MDWRIPPLPLRWLHRLRRHGPAPLITPERAQAARMAALEAHLRAEQPDLLAVLPTVLAFDRVLSDLGLLGQGGGLATRIAWWPTISILGLYSAGKSSFVNNFLGDTLQAAGSQAVDDRFTVICHGAGSDLTALPGSALNADVRLPFFRIADALDRAATDEGRHIDSYLQLKASPSPNLKGRILIDSPGFDADTQRQATLSIIEHILEVSDLVLIFFDARRPEPGAMPDTLRYLVEPAARRPDGGKVLYILNHCDAVAREDNLDEVAGAWQRSLSQAGLTANRVFCIYNADLAPEIGDPAIRARFQTRSANDLAEIHARIAAVDAARGYRLLGQLQALTHTLEAEALPHLEAATMAWRRETLAGDAALLSVVLVGLGLTTVLAGADPLLWAGLAALLIPWHVWWQHRVRRRLAPDVPERLSALGLEVRAAFLHNTRQLSTLLRARPDGVAKAYRALPLLRQAIQHQTQLWNDRHIGSTAPAPVPTPAKSRRAANRPERPPPPTPEADEINPLLQADSLFTVLADRLALKRRKSAPTQPVTDEIDFFEDR